MFLGANIGFLGSPACHRAILEMVEVLCKESHVSLYGQISPPSRCGAPSFINVECRSTYGRELIDGNLALGMKL